MARLATLLVTALFAVLLQVTVAPGASAGGSWLAPVQDRYEPGDVATLVGYSGSGAYGTVAHPRAIPLYVGDLDISTVDFAHRSAISFDLPARLQPGVYWLEYCNAGCEKKLGDLIGGFVYVGVDPSHPPAREWPESEPQVANLAADALVAGPGYELTAAQFRARSTQPSPSNLTHQYLECVVAAGVDLRNAQVLVTERGIPWHVKTGIDVPGAVHGPCLAVIGGPATVQSSWGTSACAAVRICSPGS